MNFAPRPRHLSVVALLLAACGSDATEGSSNDPNTMAGLGDGQYPPSASPVGLGPGGGRDDAPLSGASPAGAPLSDSATSGAIGDEASIGSDSSGSIATPTSGGPVAPSSGAPLPAPPSDATSGEAEGVAIDPSIAPEDPIIAPPTDVQPQAGLLTAGTWDDNQNFARFIDYRAEVFGSQMVGLLPIEEDEHVAVQELGISTPRPHTRLDVALVVDTTGSMGDELAYLQTEFNALSSAIEDAYPDSHQRWSLVLYRDVGDEYETRWFDFRTDAEEFRSKLLEQVANGGGDTPEAPEAALEVMNELAWRTSDQVARLAFWIADAPHHTENAQALADSIRTSQELGIHLYPVASSGVDELTELSMRSAAQLTGGRYLFLTDDSGVGGAHKEPTIPCYFVTRLDHAILRMVDIEMSGEYREPEAGEVIRTGGDPQDGACTLQSGETLKAF